MTIDDAIEDVRLFTPTVLILVFISLGSVFLFAEHPNLTKF